ncbi:MULTISPECIES: hypothetical protein [Nonomuraea]|uniref:Excreted virulence factor EspC (Type VII ESX diderm) n=1 Tax=Nonomuraea ferruginea TaxID=46174 RepID=A0ABT4T9W3_9ACTN|nr:hypothetical protein [Nonomuraea ferruginea]MDA0646292.1 hypothetical protein [Nonomuraea ferruginea]
MSTGFEMAPESLRLQATRVHQHGEDYEAAVARLREGGGQWGDDGLFAALQLAWTECREVILTAVPGLSGSINGVGDGMVAASANIGAVETALTTPEPDRWA